MSPESPRGKLIHHHAVVFSGIHCFLAELIDFWVRCSDNGAPND